MCEFTRINLADECSARACRSGGPHRACRGRPNARAGASSMQMTRVYRLDSEVKLIKSACTHTIASSSCAGSSIVLNGKRPCRVQLFVCDTSFFPVIPVVAQNAGFVPTLGVPAGSCQLRLSTALSVPSRSSRNS